MRVHKVTFAALIVAASLSLTACQSDDGGTGKSDSSSGSTAASSGGGSGSGASDGGSGQGGANDSAGTSGKNGGTNSAGKSSGGQDTAAGTGSAGSGKAGKCRTDELEITATDSTVSGDPEGTVAVRLKNRGGRDCTLSGYAGVDLKTNAGSLSANRTGEKADRTVLKDGQSTYFGIQYPINRTGGSGVRITGLLVTPPDETKTVTLAWPGAATLPATEDSASSVKVGPMGSAGQGG